MFAAGILLSFLAVKKGWLRRQLSCSRLHC